MRHHVTVPTLAMALAAVALAALASCGIDTRSDDFECEVAADCDPWQRCLEGTCVVLGTACHPDCDQCTGGICVMDCTATNSCQGTVRCPPSSLCRIRCSGSDSCASGVECDQATACEVTCDGEGSCSGDLQCGIGSCRVQCTGLGSCDGSLDCRDSCSCLTNCRSVDGSRTCLPDCPSGCDDGANCITGGGCDVCEG